MENQKDKNIEIFFAANQRYLFKFLINLILIACIGAFMYGVFGDSMSDVFDQPEVVSEEVQKKNRQKRKIAANDELKIGQLEKDGKT